MGDIKIGSMVRMVNCLEADTHKDRTWITRSEPWVLCGTEVVLLEGKSGGFATEFLEVIESPKLNLKFVGWDDWSRAVYEDEQEKLFKDVDPRASRQGDICTASSFGGEPDTPIHYIDQYKDCEIIYNPHRMTWQ